MLSSGEPERDPNRRPALSKLGVFVVLEVIVMPRVGFDLKINTSEVMAIADRLSENLSEAQMDRLMYRTLKEAARKVRTETKRAVVQDYAVTQGFVASGIKEPRMGGGGGRWSCIIPMDSKRGVIGQTFHASGGRFGKRVLKSGKKQHLKLRAQIIRGQRSVLPDKMEHQGGNPPFMAGKVAFTRTTKHRFPIARVVGLSVPQMPINKSEPKVEAAIVKYMTERLEHNFQHLFGK